MTLPTVEFLPPLAMRPQAFGPVPTIGEDISLCLELPIHEYRTRKIVPIPFDPRVSHNGKFNSLREAMSFIGKHCEFHHHTFNKKLARLYLPFCRVLSFVHGGYVSPGPLSKKDFENAFAEVNRGFKGER
jgi:hypothetical protein